MHEKSRILYASFDRVPAPKGAGTHIAQFVRELANRYDVTLLTPGEADSEGENFGARHLTVGVEGKNFLRDTETFSKAVSGHIGGERYDAVHFRSVWEGIPAIEQKAAKGYRAVYEINGLPSIELKYHYPAVAKNKPLMDRIREMELAAMLEADVIIVPSSVTMEHIMGRGIAGRKIKVIPNGVDTSLFVQPEKEPAEPVRILYAGTLAPWQGVAHLLEAFKRASRERDARLCIVGKARKDWLKDLRRQARKLKISELIEFKEPVRHRDMPAVIADAHIGAAPFPATERNTRQGFCPIKVIEYMACARPVVAPDLPAVRELARHDAEALLYKPNSMSRLADSLVCLIEDGELRKKLGQAGRKRAETLTWKASRAALAGVYREL